MKNSMWVLDVSWLCNLFYFAGKNNGEENSAIRGFLYTICKILNKQSPHFLVAAIDSHLSFRKVLEPTYKAHRKDKEEGYVQQLNQIKEAIDYLGIPSICIDHYEADDVMMTLAEEAKRLSIPYVGVTKDKDFMQALVKGKVGMYNKSKEGWSFFGHEQAEKKWGVKSGQFVEYQCLVGDSADNIKGAKGIGPKGAQYLLNEHGNIENANKKYSELGPRLQKGLTDLNPRLDTVRKLVTLVKDVGNVEFLDDYEVSKLKLDRPSLHKVLVRNDVINLENLILETWDEKESSKQSGNVEW